MHAHNRQNNLEKSRLNLSGESLVGKIFEGEMLMITLPTTLLRIFRETILNCQDNVKSIIDPENNFKRNSLPKH